MMGLFVFGDLSRKTCRPWGGLSWHWPAGRWWPYREKTSKRAWTSSRARTLLTSATSSCKMWLHHVTPPIVPLTTAERSFPFFQVPAHKSTAAAAQERDWPHAYDWRALLHAAGLCPDTCGPAGEWARQGDGEWQTVQAARQAGDRQWEAWVSHPGRELTVLEEVSGVIRKK